MISVEHLMEIQERLHNGDNLDEVFNDIYELGRADAIDEFLNTIKKDFEFKVYVNGGDSCDYTQQIISNMEFIAEQLKEKKNE